MTTQSLVPVLSFCRRLFIHSVFLSHRLKLRLSIYLFELDEKSKPDKSLELKFIFPCIALHYIYSRLSLWIRHKLGKIIH